jgi:flagellar basal body-associated protein FliL
MAEEEEDEAEEKEEREVLVVVVVMKAIVAIVVVAVVAIVLVFVGGGPEAAFCLLFDNFSVVSDAVLIATRKDGGDQRLPSVVFLALR